MAAGLIPAATMPIRSASRRMWNNIQEKPNLIPEGEQRLRRSRTRDERGPYGFPLIRRQSIFGPKCGSAWISESM
jgi:hypothetical protein